MEEKVSWTEKAKAKAMAMAMAMATRSSCEW
jgi:hypothetical protein